MNVSLDKLAPHRNVILELPLIQHVTTYLDLVGKKEIALTLTGNINRASMENISTVIPYPDHH